MGGFFAVLSYFKVLRCSEAEELQGLDKSKHGGQAYNWTRPIPGDCPAVRAGSDDGGKLVPTNDAVDAGETQHRNAVVPFDDN